MKQEDKLTPTQVNPLFNTKYPAFNFAAFVPKGYHSLDLWARQASVNADSENKIICWK